MFELRFRVELDRVAPFGAMPHREWPLQAQPTVLAPALRAATSGTADPDCESPVPLFFVGRCPAFFKPGLSPTEQDYEQVLIAATKLAQRHAEFAIQTPEQRMYIWAASDQRQVELWANTSKGVQRFIEMSSI